MTNEYNLINLEYKAIMEMIQPKSSVLDLGCGNGELLEHLITQKQVRGQGVEIDEQSIYKCVAKGLSVTHSDIDTGLSEYADKAFDYVILNQTFQQIKKPDYVLKEALRVGHKVIVGFPNFVSFKARFQLFFNGRVPVTPSLPYQWYDTPNVHFLSIADFIAYCKERNFTIEKTVYIGRRIKIYILPNLFAQVGIFLITALSSHSNKNQIK
jgi:methionine biosynthesis protein MetW